MNTKIESFEVENSSNISKLEFDHLTNVLSVHFKNGSMYQFVDVNHSTYLEFIKSESFGKFFQKEIKNKFDYIRRV